MSNAIHLDAGGLLMIGLPGKELDDSTLRLIEGFRISNFILFKRNVGSPAQLHALCHDLDSACHNHGLGKPLIAIDQEGGSVTRLPAPFTQFGDARQIGLAASPEKAARHYSATVAKELLKIGINMNLAPVLDICPTGQGCFMERRCLSDRPEQAAALGALIITEMQQQGVASCAKHFPGLGAVSIDPHQTLPVVAKTAQDMLDQDLQPFRAAIQAGVAAVMTSHTVYHNLDTEHPATLSFSILTDLLRGQLGYDGVVITDDLEMGAIAKNESVPMAALKAFQAGADLLLICENHDIVVDTCLTLQKAVNLGQFDAKRLVSSLDRIERVRQRFAIC